MAFSDSSGNGFPVSQGYSNLYFFYKYHQVGIFPYFSVWIQFFNADSSAAGGGSFSTNASAIDFTLGNIPIVITGNPVTCIIYVTISNIHDWTSYGGTYIIDDFSFDYPVGISSFAVSKYFLNIPVPNPGANFTMVKFNVPGATDVDFKIADLTGSQLKFIHAGNVIAEENSLNLDLSDLGTGMYLLQMSSSFGILSRKIIVSR